jgi:hypothetical protein
MGGLVNPFIFAAAGYTANAVDFDGTNDYLLRGAGFTGAADSSTGIFSAWIRLDGGDASGLYICSNTGDKFIAYRRSNNKISFNLSGTAGGDFGFETVNSYTASAAWLHILASWSTNFSAGNKLSHLYINNTSDKTVIYDTDPGFIIDYTVADNSVGANTAAGSKFNGCMSEVYFAPGQFLDFSVQANREKFILGGKPVSLGADGSTPTGTAPILYLKNPAASFGTNSGTGGNLTITGTLDVATTSPSD